MSRYDTEIDVAESGSSHAQMLELIGYNKRVLDIGCATGSLARVLVERGCSVSGVEADADAAEQARPLLEQLVVGDVEKLDLGELFAEHGFDVVLFGDVLEHLRDPIAALRQARPLLVPGGSVVISIPNVAHGAVRLALLKGEWRYQALGLLDETHLRFFTYENLTELLREAGFVATDVRRTIRGVFDTEVEVRREDYPQSLIETLLDDPEATTYQFVVRGVPDDAERAIVELQEREQEQRNEIVALKREVERLRALTDQLDAANARIADLEAHVRSINEMKTIRFTRRARELYNRLRRSADR